MPVAVTSAANIAAAAAGICDLFLARSTAPRRLLLKHTASCHTCARSGSNAGEIAGIFEKLDGWRRAQARSAALDSRPLTIAVAGRHRRPRASTPPGIAG